MRNIVDISPAGRMNKVGRAGHGGRAGLLILCALLLAGDLGWSLRERAVQELFKAELLRFSQNATLLNVLIGALPALVAFCLGPPVGAWSDRTRTRYGRRVPFVLGTAVVSVIGMLGLAYSEEAGRFLGGSAHAGDATLASLATCWVLFEIATIVGNPLFVALINDTVPPAFLGRFFGLLRVVSLAVGAGFFATFFGNSLASVFQPLLLGIAVVYFGSMLLVCWRVREPALDVSAPDAGSVNWRGDTQWGWLFGAVALSAVALQPININALNASAQFGVDTASFGGAIALSYAISIVLAWPLGWLADRYHPLRIGGVALTLYSLSMLLAWQLVEGRETFLAALVVHGVLAGCFLTGTASLLPALLPRARFSQLAAMSASVTALLTVAATVSLGTLLDASGRDYRLLYLMGSLAAAGGVLLWRVLLRRYVYVYPAK